MGNVFATHAASDEDTIIYLKSKHTGKFWHSNSREGEGFKWSYPGLVDIPILG